MGAKIEQDNNGRWNIKVKHNGPDTVQIPVTLTYEGIECNFDCKSSEQTIPTDWETEAGKTIDTNKISLNSEEVVKGNCIYHVDGIKWNNVQPFSGKTYTLEIQSSNDVIEFNGTATLAARYTYKVEGNVEEEKLVDNQSVSWQSNNTNIAVVDENGVVKGVNSGGTGASVTITGTYGNITGSIVITVGANSETPVSSGSTSGETGTVEPTGITLNKSSITLTTYGNRTENIVATVWPSNASNKTLIWETSDNEIATHVKSGNYDYIETAHNVKVGSAVITVYTYDRKYSASCTVNVEREGTIVTSISPETVNLPYTGDSFFVTVETEDIGRNSGYQIGKYNEGNGDGGPMKTEQVDGGANITIGLNKSAAADFVILIQGLWSDSSAKRIDVHQDAYPDAIDIWNSGKGGDIFYADKTGEFYFVKLDNGYYSNVKDFELVCVPSYVDELIETAEMPDWIHFGGHGFTPGTSRTTIFINLDENTTGENRDGYITFRGGVTVTVHQSNTIHE